VADLFTAPTIELLAHKVSTIKVLVFVLCVCLYM